MTCHFALLFIVALLSGSAFPAAHFTDGVRKTEPLPAEEQLKKFKLPPGFEIQLVAFEPSINKPINMAFDSKGRLWVTSTVEYPWPAKDPEKTRDAIIVLEDFDATGRAQKVTRFAENLNIPIGLYPYKNGVIGFSIPNLYFFQDTDGDGKADKKDIFVGPFGYERDTHGMISALRRSYDGLLYACHGFNNISNPKGKDGSTITMHSGNTWRVAMDGTRLEQHTWGQTNPFGMVIDPWGNFYTADCHSSPIYQILRGSYYPSFGKPDDGLGFGPTMMSHSHGSTAIGGIVYFADDRFPKEFQDNLIVGNVMTSRVNRDRLNEQGTTRIAIEMPDLVECEDPWFRPVDMQLGPDGAIYIADFYNRIIGHYEVPLTHPGRDFTRGRIWRIVYKGEKGDQPAPSAPNLSAANVDELIKTLDHPNITARMLALSEISDRIGAPAGEALRGALKSPSPRQRALALWGLYRLEQIDDATLESAVKDDDPLVRTHVFRMLSERAKLSPALQKAVENGIDDDNPFAARAASDAAGRHPSIQSAKMLLDALGVAMATDTHRIHVMRMALRNHLKHETLGAELLKLETDETGRKTLAGVALGTPSEAGARLALKSIENKSALGDGLTKAARHAIRYLPEAEVAAVVTAVKTRVGAEVQSQLTALKGMADGFSQRGMQQTENFKSWAREAVFAVLDAKMPDSSGWTALTIESKPGGQTWPAQIRSAKDGKSEAYFSSLLLGESFTGILRSAPFDVPKTLSFHLAGHNGQSPQAPKKNVVRLRDAATGEVLVEAFPPYNDVAELNEWKLEKHVGRNAVMELVDGYPLQGFAWIAVGRFDPPVVALPVVDAGQQNNLKPALELAQALQFKEAAPAAAKALAKKGLPSDIRLAAAKAAFALDAKATVGPASAILKEADDSAAVRDGLAQSLGSLDLPEARTALIEAMRASPQRQQSKLAQALTATQRGAGALLDAAEKGTLPKQLLLDENIKKRVIDSKLENAADRIATLTKGLKPADSETRKLIDDKCKAYERATPVLAAGEQVFAKSCAICHQLEGKGALVGPQLDGVGARGLERLCEDILDPHRNVDVAFRTSTLKLQGGKVVTGLFRREEGELVVLADATGKEFELQKKEISERRESGYSLMPDNFGEVLTPEDFNNLIGYLLSKNTANK